jgi:hypothetical protein
VDVSSDPSIDHVTIDKSARLHARVISEVLAVVGSGHRLAAPAGAKPTAVNHSEPGGEADGAKSAPGGEGSVKPAETPATPAKSSDGAMNSMRDGTPIIALPERQGAHVSSDAPVTPPPASR